jgi:hypothetical protein
MKRIFAGGANPPLILDHFMTHVTTSKDEWIVLLDSHKIHMALEAFKHASEVGTAMIILLLIHSVNCILTWHRMGPSELFVVSAWILNSAGKSLVYIAL